MVKPDVDEPAALFRLKVLEEGVRIYAGKRLYRKAKIKGWGELAVGGRQSWRKKMRLHNV